MTTPVQITLLTQPDCAYCDHAKQVLARVGQDHPLRITEIDLTTEQGRDLAGRAGVLFAPGVLIDAAPFSFGRLSERKLRRALGTHAATSHPEPTAAGDVTPGSPPQRVKPTMNSASANPATWPIT